VIDRFDPAELSENVRTRFYIGGQWRRPRPAEPLEIISPLFPGKVPVDPLYRQGP
jgi:hypothetical protein